MSIIYFKPRIPANKWVIEEPAPTFNAIHDRNRAAKAIPYVSASSISTSPVDRLFGASRTASFPNPAIRGQTSLGLTVTGNQRICLKRPQLETSAISIISGHPRWQKHGRRYRFPIAGFLDQHRLLLSRGSTCESFCSSRSIAQKPQPQVGGSARKATVLAVRARPSTVRSGFYIQR